MTRFDAETCSVTSPGLELAIHNGTVRDLAFVSRASGTPVLVSGGAGTYRSMSSAVFMLETSRDNFDILYKNTYKKQIHLTSDNILCYLPLNSTLYRRL